MALVLIIGISRLQAQAFLNGGLEAKPGTACSVDITNAVFNNRIENVIGLGVVSKLDLLTDQCGLGVPREGNYFVGLQAEDGKTDAIAIRVDQTLQSRKYYYLEFFARLGESDTPDYNLALGMNSNPNFHGELLYTTRDIPQGWRRYEVFFRAPGNGEYITVLIESKGKTRIFIDGFKMICPGLDIGRDTVFCEEVRKEIVLPEYFSDASWSDGQTGNKALFTRPGTYSISANFGSCALFDTITFDLDPSLCTCIFDLPNIISNSSATNGQLMVKSNCRFKSFDLSIFDRWGNLVFAANDPQAIWSGLGGGGKPLESGVYQVLVAYALDDAGNDQIRYKYQQLVLVD